MAYVDKRIDGMKEEQMNPIEQTWKFDKMESWKSKNHIVLIPTIHIFVNDPYYFEDNFSIHIAFLRFHAYWRWMKK